MDPAGEELALLSVSSVTTGVAGGVGHSRENFIPNTENTSVWVGDCGWRGKPC